MKKQDDFQFTGFEPSNTTPVPDVLFDQLLDHLTGAELKILLYIIRRTWGFKKDTDAISLTQFLNGITTKDGRVLDEGCGVSDRPTLVKSLASLETKGCVESEKSTTSHGDKAITIYRVRFHRVVGKPNHHPNGVVGKPNGGSVENPTTVVGKPNQQETVLQETVQQQTEESNSVSFDALLTRLQSLEKENASLKAQLESVTHDNPSLDSASDSIPPHSSNTPPSSVDEEVTVPVGRNSHTPSTPAGRESLETSIDLIAKEATGISYSETPFKDVPTEEKRGNRRIAPEVERAKWFYDTVSALGQEFFEDLTYKADAIYGKTDQSYLLVQAYIADGISAADVRLAFEHMYNETDKNGVQFWKDPGCLTTRAFIKHFRSKLASAKFKKKQAQRDEQKNAIANNTQSAMQLTSFAERNRAMREKYVGKNQTTSSTTLVAK